MNPVLLVTLLAIGLLVFCALWIRSWSRARKLAQVLAGKDAEIAAAHADAEKVKTHASMEITAAEARATATAKSANDEVLAAKARAVAAIDAANEKAEASRRHYEAEFRLSQEQSVKWLSEAQKSVDAERDELRRESGRIEAHYEAECRKFKLELDETLQRTLAEIASLKRYEGLQDAEKETQRVVAEALAEANALRADAEVLLDSAKMASKEERNAAVEKARQLRAQAAQLLEHATRNAARIVDDAHKKAESIAGEAYHALREKDNLQQAIRSIRNQLDGYGDRYVAPTHSIVDELAAGYEHTEAGRMLQVARDQTKKMVGDQMAAECDYAEASRRETAIRFVIDAFNGRVDALLTEAESENVGTLEQMIRDAYNLVNLNGQAFRNARILPIYLEARLAELKWAVATFELRKRERDEQRRIKEQIREEEKARREYERAMREAKEEEEKIQKALEMARSEAEHASAQERQKFEQEIAILSQRLVEAEERNQRAISMAQQTKKGNVYVISNLGSFGEGIFKVGMTRRLEPMDRIWELSDASVPFDFDVHAMIPSDDAPALEAALHQALDELRVNKVNFRKEFFYVGLDRIRTLVIERGIEASFTLLAEAHEYRESKKLAGMSPEDRSRYLDGRAGGFPDRGEVLE